MDEQQIMELQKLTLEGLKVFICDNCGSHNGEYIHETQKNYNLIKVRCLKCGHTILI